MKAKERSTKQKQLDRMHGKLALYLRDYRGKVDELFRIFDPEVRAKAMQSVTKLELHEATRLLDRIIYLTRTRIVRTKREVVRCSGKVIYDMKGAQANVNRIWNKGRGKMRIYLCPSCMGHHLTHKVHRDSDRLAA